GRQGFVFTNNMFEAGRYSHHFTYLYYFASRLVSRHQSRTTSIGPNQFDDAAHARSGIPALSDLNGVRRQPQLGPMYTKIGERIQCPAPAGKTGRTENGPPQTGFEIEEF
ncbi:MAG: hypothetical protein VXY82_12050, partial [Planctomycetota bacterium]|nr:hypothetical protein [Planctomycetota bacterium]